MFPDELVVFPDGQLVHEVEPVEAAYLPAGHNAQSLEESAPRMFEDFPFGQDVQ